MPIHWSIFLGSYKLTIALHDELSCQHNYSVGVNPLHFFLSRLQIDIQIKSNESFLIPFHLLSHYNKCEGDDKEINFNTKVKLSKTNFFCTFCNWPRNCKSDIQLYSNCRGRYKQPLSEWCVNLTMQFFKLIVILLTLFSAYLCVVTILRKERCSRW